MTMITIEEYEKEHNSRKISRIEIILGLVLFVLSEMYFIYKAIVDCWPILRSNLATLIN
jgi:hypothetical protein